MNLLKDSYLIIISIFLLFLIFNKAIVTNNLRNAPIINRWNIKVSLEENFQESLNKLNNNLAENIKSLGTFSLTFDIWTSNSQTAFLGIILAYISPDFKLEYKLIGISFFSYYIIFYITNLSNRL